MSSLNNDLLAVIADLQEQNENLKEQLIDAKKKVISASTRIKELETRNKKLDKLHRKNQKTINKLSHERNVAVMYGVAVTKGHERKKAEVEKRIREKPETTPLKMWQAEATKYKRENSELRKIARELHECNQRGDDNCNGCPFEKDGDCKATFWTRYWRLDIEAGEQA